MIGINVENLNTLIKKNNWYLSSYNSSSERLVNAINDLNTCYDGSSLEYLFHQPINEIKDIQKISKIIQNYSDVLTSVRVSYKKQDQNLKMQINHINSNLK